MAGGGKHRRAPWWLPVPGLAIATAWAGYQGGGMAEFTSTLLWPGTALYVLVTVATYLGWRRDTD